MDSSDNHKNLRGFAYGIKFFEETSRETEKLENVSSIKRNNVSEKLEMRRKHSEYIRSCFDIVDNENELRTMHKVNRKLVIDNLIIGISVNDEEKREIIKKFCEDIDKDFEVLISDYKKGLEGCNSNENETLENAKSIYVQMMDKYFVKEEFIFAKELQELHEKSKSLSHRKLEIELSPNPIDNRIEQQFNDIIETIYGQYKRQNMKNAPLNPAIGIDLGTNYCQLGIMNKEKVHIISNLYGVNTTPSYIAFTKDGHELVGKPAKEQAYENPANTIYDVKRMIGRKYDDIDIQEDMKFWPFEVINESNTLKVKLRNEENITLCPEDLMAKVLSKLKSDAENFLGLNVNNVVITVPAYFNDAQRQATKDAGILAGLNVLQILNEPTAVAIAYSHRIKDNFSKKILIYGLAERTFDVSVVIIEKGIIDVKAVGRDTHLGCVDFDKRVLDFLFKKFKDTLCEAVNEKQLKRSMKRLENYWEIKKLELSEKSSTDISIDSFLPGLDFEYKFTLRLFEDLCIDLFEKTIKIMDQTLKCAQMRAEDINDVVLIGGSTKIPKIRSLLQKYLNNTPFNEEIKPDDAVVYGASIQAALFNTEKSIVSNVSRFPPDMGASYKSKSIKPSFKMATNEKELGNKLRVNQKSTTERPIKVYEDLNSELSEEELSELSENLNSEHKQELENAKLIYVQEMDKHFVEHKFLFIKELQELHEKSRSLSYNKLKKEFSPNPINKRIEELFNDLIENIYNQYKRQNLMNIPIKPAIGIDLGTTYCCFGVLKKGKVHIISNTYGLNTTPSYIAFNENGEEHVGQSAKEQAFENPANTIYDVKRLIGRNYNDIDIQKDMKLWPFKIINERNTLKVKLRNEDKITLYPEELSAKILSKIKSDAENFLGFKVNNAVITVPAYFNDAQRQATKDAGLLAGLNVLQILNEPTAAAIAYNHKIKDDFRKNALIYDLGGGTFDVAVVVIENGIIDVKAVGGDTHLGGVDFDQRVLDFIIRTFKDKFCKIVDKEKLQRALSRLRTYCEKKKWELSERSSTIMSIDCLLPEWDFRYELTRKLFEDLCIDLFDKTIKIIDETIKSAQMKANDINDIVLIGGSTKIPKIQSLLNDYFQYTPLNKDIKPDEAVAYGATIQAALLNGEKLLNSNMTLISDVLPFSLGIEVLNKSMAIIIPRNTKIPTERTQKFQTTANNQTFVKIQIFEGEHKIAKYNRLLGEFTIDGLPKKRAGKVKVDVTIKIDKEGVLHIKGVTSNGSTDLTVKDHRGRIPTEKLEMLVTKFVV